MKSAFLALFLFLASNVLGQINVPNSYKDTATVNDSAKMVWQIGPPWIPAKLRSQTFSNLALQIGNLQDCTNNCTFTGLTRVDSIAVKDSTRIRSNAVSYFSGPLAQIVVGAKLPRGNNSAITIGRSVTGNLNAHGITDSSVINLGVNFAYASYDDRVNFVGSNNMDHHAGFQFAPVWSNIGTLTRMEGFVSAPRLDSGAVSNVYHFVAFGKTGNVVTPLQIGFRCDDNFSGATASWCFYNNGSSNNYFGTGIQVYGLGGSTPTNFRAKSEWNYNSASTLSVVTHGSSAGSLFTGIRSGGTFNSPTANAADQFLAVFNGYGYNGTAYTSRSGNNGGGMFVATDSVWNSVNNGTYVAWNAIPRNDTVSQEFMRVQGTKLAGLSLLVGTTTNNGAKFQVNGTSTFSGKVAGSDSIVSAMGVRAPMFNTTGNAGAGAGVVTFGVASPCTSAPVTYIPHQFKGEAGYSLWCKP